MLAVNNIKFWTIASNQNNADLISGLSIYKYNLVSKVILVRL